MSGEMAESVPFCRKPDLLFLWSQTLPSLFCPVSPFNTCKLFIGQLIGRKRDAKERSFWLNAGIFYNLFWLILFKYSTFITENLNLLLSYTKTGLQFPVIRLSLPLGISFYTFQAIAYLADVYKKEIRSEHSLLRFCTWFSMFTQVTSGPITRYQEIRSQLIRRRFPWTVWKPVLESLLLA